MTRLEVIKSSTATGADVAVVMPVGRFDVYVDEAARSILDQQGIGVHLVVALDGIDVPKGWGVAHDPRVSLLGSPNRQGVASTLNQALELVESEFIARMDGDDLALPGRLRIQWDYLKQHPKVGVVGTYAQVIDEEGRLVGRKRGPRHPLRLGWSLQVHNTLVHPSVMFRRSTILSAGGYRASMEGVEDYDLWLRVLATSRIAVVGQYLLQYRRHGAQVTSAGTTREQFDRLLEAKCLGRGWAVRVTARILHRSSMSLRSLVGRVAMPIE